jgi:hypothetical protein
MLADHLGQETFLKGVSNYLKAHAYGNAKTGKSYSHAILLFYSVRAASPAIVSGTGMILSPCILGTNWLQSSQLPPISLDLYSANSLNS